jgi:hypothetical protein
MARLTTGFSQRSQEFLCALCGQKLLTTEIAEKPIEIAEEILVSFTVGNKKTT